MKQFFAICLLLTAGSLFALDGYFVGLGAEANANTREGAAFGGGLSFGLDLNPNMALGIKASYSNNFDTISTIEPAAFFRYYLPLPVRGLYAQAELGGIIFFEEKDVIPAFLGALAVGWQFVFKNNLYLEPFVRGGYPIAWGAGVNFGIKIPKNIAHGDIVSQRDTQTQRRRGEEE